MAQKAKSKKFAVDFDCFLSRRSTQPAEAAAAPKFLSGTNHQMLKYLIWICVKQFFHDHAAMQFGEHWIFHHLRPFLSFRLKERGVDCWRLSPNVIKHVNRLSFGGIHELVEHKKGNTRWHSAYTSVRISGKDLCWSSVKQMTELASISLYEHVLEVGETWKNWESYAGLCAIVSRSMHHSR